MSGIVNNNLKDPNFYQALASDKPRTQRSLEKISKTSLEGNRVAAAVQSLRLFSDTSLDFLGHLTNAPVDFVANLIALNPKKAFQELGTHIKEAGKSLLMLALTVIYSVYGIFKPKIFIYTTSEVKELLESKEQIKILEKQILASKAGNTAKMDKFEKQLNDVRFTRDLAIDNRKALQAELDGLRTQNEGKDEMLASLRARISMLEDRIRISAQYNGDIERISETKDAMIANLQKQNNLLATMNDPKCRELQKVNQELEARLQQFPAMGASEEAQERLEEALKEIHTLNGKKHRYEAIIRNHQVETKEQIEPLKAVVSQLLNQVNDLKQQCESQESFKEEQQLLIQSLRAELEIYKNDVEIEQIIGTDENLEERLEAAFSSMKDLQTDLDTAIDGLESPEFHTTSELQETLANMQSEYERKLAKQQTDFNLQISNLRTRHQLKKRELRNKCQKLSKRADTLFDEQMANYEKFSLFLEKLEKRSIPMAELKPLLTKLSKMKSENEKIKKRTERLQQRYNQDFLTIKKHLFGTLEAMKAREAEFQEELLRLDATCATAMLDNLDIKEQNQKWKGRVNTLNAQLNTLMDEVETARDERRVRAEKLLAPHDEKLIAQEQAFGMAEQINSWRPNSVVITEEEFAEFKQARIHEREELAVALKH